MAQGWQDERWMAERVRVAPGWASTLRLSAVDDAHEVAPLDVGLLYLVAGEMSERMPYPGDCSWDQDAAADRLRDMLAGAPIRPLRVEVAMSSAMSRLATGRSKAVASAAERLGRTLNRGASLFESVNVSGDTLRFEVANTPALLEAHRAFGRALRGRGRTDEGFRVEDRAYVALDPRLAAAFGSANSAVVYARALCWLRRTGMPGLPRGCHSRDDATGALTITVPHDDLVGTLGLMVARTKASYLQAVIERVNHDLAPIGLYVGARWAGMGKRPGAVTVTLGRIPGGPVIEDTAADGGGLIGIPGDVKPRTGRWRPTPAAVRHAAEAARIEREASPAPVPATSPAMPARMAPTIAPIPEPPTPTVDDDLPPMPEPSFAAFLEQAEPDAADGHHADDADGDDDEPEQPRDAHDGWGWQRNLDHDDELYAGSELLAHLDEGTDGFDFDAPGPHDRPLTLPGEVHAGPLPRDDTRPEWLVRHLRYSVGWLDGAWADRPMSAMQSTAMASWVPTALWMPGMGAQPAHVWSAADLLDVTMRAMDRRRWQDIRARLANGETTESSPSLGWAMDSDDYPALDAVFGTEGAEPWDAHLERPDLSPRDSYYADLALARRRERSAAERAARAKAKAA